jgi:hypothetical protein
MLIPAAHVPERDQRLNCQIYQWIAYDPENGAFMRKTQQPAGRRGRYLYRSHDRTMTIFAETDDEAIRFANERAYKAPHFNGKIRKRRYKNGKSNPK